MHLKSFVDWVSDQLVIVDANGKTAFALEKELGGITAKGGTEQTVEGAWGAATLNTAEDFPFGFIFGSLIDFSSKVDDIHLGHLLGNENGGLLSALATEAVELIDNLVDAHHMLWGDDDFGGKADSGEHSKVTAVVAHDLDDGAAMVAGAGVAEMVDAVGDGIHRGIETEGVVGGGNIVIDGARDTDAVDAEFGESHSAHIGAVAADADEGFDAEFP